MRIIDVFTEVDEVKPSQFDDSQKMKWLNEVEGRIVKEIILTHEIDASMEEFEFNGFNEETSVDTELIAKEPYALLYKFYIMSMIDLHNEEYDRYQNTAALFNNFYQDFANYWNRTHRSNGIKRFMN